MCVVSMHESIKMGGGGGGGGMDYRGRRECEESQEGLVCGGGGCYIIID